MGRYNVSQWSLVLSSEQVSCLPISHNFVGPTDDGNLLLPDGISHTKHGKATPTDRQIRKNSMYQMKCMDCPLKRQTGQTFYTRYKEHTQAIRNNNSNTGYLNDILSMGHAYSSITERMKIMKIEKKGKHLNTLEKHPIYKVSRNRLHMNDAHTMSVTHYSKSCKN
jgi:hypothetical protein